MRQQGYAADAFVVNQFRGQARHIFLHDLDRGRVPAQLDVIAWRCLTRLLERVFQTLPIGNDQCHRLLSPRSHDHDLTHKLTLFQQTLDQLRRDILAVRQLEQILLAIRDVQVAVLPDIADVARVEPTVLQHLGRRFRLTVVTSHHVWSTYENLAVRRNLELDTVKRNPY